ncbi:MAG: hypothetical protein R6U96_09625 [Promethearchaeia archaeon]
MQNLTNLEEYEVVKPRRILNRKNFDNQDADLNYYQLLNKLGFISKNEYAVIKGMVTQNRIDLRTNLIKTTLQKLLRKNLIKSVSDLSDVPKEKKESHKENIEKFLTLLDG